MFDPRAQERNETKKLMTPGEHRKGWGWKGVESIRSRKSSLIALLQLQTRMHCDFDNFLCIPDFHRSVRSGPMSCKSKLATFASNNGIVLKLAPGKADKGPNRADVLNIFASLVMFRNSRMKNQTCDR